MKYSHCSECLLSEVCQKLATSIRCVFVFSWEDSPSLETIHTTNFLYRIKEVIKTEKILWRIKNNRPGVFKYESHSYTQQFVKYLLGGARLARSWIVLFVKPYSCFLQCKTMPHDVPPNIQHFNHRNSKMRTSNRQLLSAQMTVIRKPCKMQPANRQYSSQSKANHYTTDSKKVPLK